MKQAIKTTEAIFPMPVLLVATYNEDGSIDVMNAAWGTMLDREHVALNLTETHKTVENIKKTQGLCSPYRRCRTCGRGRLFRSGIGTQRKR